MLSAVTIARATKKMAPYGDRAKSLNRYTAPRRGCENCGTYDSLGRKASVSNSSCISSSSYDPPSLGRREFDMATNMEVRLISSSDIRGVRPTFGGRWQLRTEQPRRSAREQCIWHAAPGAVQHI